MITEVKSDAPYGKRIIATMSKEGVWDTKIILTKENEPVTHREIARLHRTLAIAQRLQLSAALRIIKKKQTSVVTEPASEKDLING